MVDLPELYGAFLAELQGRGISEPPAAGADAALNDAYHRGREAWPNLPQGAEDFARFLGRVVPQPDTKDWLEGCAAKDLWLVCSYLAGSAEAQAIVDQHLCDVAKCLGEKMRLSVEERADLLQDLRVSLLVGAPAGIRRYSGTGSLRGWLRALAANRIRNVIKREKVKVHLSDVVLESMAIDDGDPELAVFKTRYLAEFRRAFRRALEDLSARERLILRYYLVDRITMTKIASMYQVNRVTVSRWFAAIRHKLSQKTQRHLASELGLTPTELRSILQIIASRLDASFSGFWEQADNLS